MKRVLKGSLVLCLVVSMVGCGSKPNNQNEQKSDEQNEILDANVEGEATTLSNEKPVTITTQKVEDKPTTTTSKKPETVITTTASEAPITTKALETSKNEGDIDSNFKAAMDSYEDFFNEYVEFMKKYKNAEDPLSMLSDYADYMTKYVDTMEKLDAIDDGTLKDDELIYYTEVQLRITKKLLEVAE